MLNKIPAIGKVQLKTRLWLIKYMIMPGIFFEEIGFKYLGPVGHDISELRSC